METVTLRNYRCFRDEQTVRLAPLTLLVGENSTGKTSFLAMLRALWDVGHGGTRPSFRRAPYDLGTFREIAHNQGARGARVLAFSAGFESTPPDHGEGTRPVRIAPDDDVALRVQVEFRNRGAEPYPVRTRFSKGAAWIELRFEDGTRVHHFGTAAGEWEYHFDDQRTRTLDSEPFDVYLISMHYHITTLHQDPPPAAVAQTLTYRTHGAPGPEDLSALLRLAESVPFPGTTPSYAGAPVRSSPRRIYDPPNLGADPEGAYIPLFLARLHETVRDEWLRLKQAIERFGLDAGLFDEIDVRRLGDTEGGPFQLQVRKFAQGRKGPRRNIADVGYGVSQVLPVVTELLRKDIPSLFLLQQPEVHLHPRAQAALGSLFCEVAAHRRTQLVIETHSDHLLNRVRMDTRDKTTKLASEDVSILYFDREDRGVRIHSLRLDASGNVLNAPDSYGSFFMQETSRSLGL